MTTAKYSFPTEIYFGAGTSEKAATLLKERALSRPLVVTDRGLSTSAMVTRLVEMLSSENLFPFLFSEIWGNPVESQVLAGVAAFNDAKADCLIAIGGGAAMDVAKAIGLMVNHPGKLFDYEDEKADARAFDQPMPFLMALPTTSGTGSEVGRSTVISDDATKAKKIIFHPILLPKIVLADPELTLKLPASITAATGMDALSHLLESFVAKGYHPICDGIALEGIRLLSSSLVDAVHDGNIHARGLMMNAAMMGAIAFQKGLGVTHSCAHALSTVADLHHGLANGIMLPHAMTFNLDAVPERFSRVTRVLSPDRKEPQFVVDWLFDLQKHIQIPSKLSTVGVKESQLSQLVDCAMADSCHHSNPKPVSKQDFERIFQAALC